MNRRQFMVSAAAAMVVAKGSFSEGSRKLRWQYERFNYDLKSGITVSFTEGGETHRMAMRAHCPLEQITPEQHAYMVRELTNWADSI